jgi:high-affinity iron transporter
VLVVMIGGTALSFVELGWLPRHETPFKVPEWLGAWFEIYSVWETLVAQVLAALFVIGSYYAAEYVKVKRPKRRGQRVTAQRATVAPAEELARG